MKTILKLEELPQLLLSILLFTNTDFSWWWYLLLFFTPDFGMLAYLFNPRVGAFFYNLFHHKGIVILIYLVGNLMDLPSLELIGSVYFGHAAFDRIFGYGLKYPDDFKNTHLGWIGK
tara:strand:+ start:116 stop:466 length:351 start_codon:yes stop_codon:yes gene_type:complete